MPYGRIYYQQRNFSNHRDGIKKPFKKQKDEFDPDLKFVDSSANNVICGDSPVNNYSPTNKKAFLFMSLFKGRSDVYAKKWQNKKGFSGYSPHCLNEWAPGICNKPRIKCSNCNQQRYSPLNEFTVEKHLRGEIIIGIYPMELDETYHFIDLIPPQIYNKLCRKMAGYY